MDYKIIVSPDLKNDIDNIYDYISIELKNPNAAQSLVEKVNSAILNITKSPLMYQKYEVKNLKSKNYRKAVINNYILIYKIDKSKNAVYILRLIYGKRDYRNWDL